MDLTVLELALLVNNLLGIVAILWGIDWYLVYIME